VKLPFFSEEALMDLRTNYEVYKEHYYNRDGRWFDEYLKRDNRVLESKFEFEMPKFNFDEDYSVSDRENVKIMYGALKHLPPSVAAQEKIWSCLAHTYFRDYTFYRLKKELDSKNDSRINSALFFKSGKNRSYFVHVLAKLWWVGYLTFDENNKDDPYWLTDFYCERDFTGKNIVFFSSSFTSNREITKGVLKALINLQREGVKIKREHYISAARYLNIIGGARVLDILTSGEIELMVTNRLKEQYFIHL